MKESCRPGIRGLKFLMYLVLLTASMTTGCAALLFSPSSQFELLPETDAAGRLSVDLVVPQPERSDFGDIVGAGLDVAVGVNLPLATLTFRTEGDAYVAAALASLGIFWLDGQLRSARTFQLPSQVRVQALDRDGAEIGYATLRGLRPGRMRVHLAGLYDQVEIAAVRLLSQAGEPLAQAPVRALGYPARASSPARSTKVVPPNLGLEATFRDPEGTNILEAEMGGALEVKALNTGAPSEGAVLTVTASPAVEGLSFQSSYPLGTVAADQPRMVRIPLMASDRLPSGMVQLMLGLTDRRGFDSVPFSLKIKTQALRLPVLTVKQFVVDNNKDGVIERGQALDLVAEVSNVGQGKARDVRARLEVPREVKRHVVFLDDNLDLELGTIPPGGSALASYSILVKQGYVGEPSLPVQIQLLERHPSVAALSSQAIVLNQARGRMRTIEVLPIAGAGVRESSGQDILMADVDAPIGRAVSPRPDAIAVVIGIERYVGKGIPPVPYAQRDAAQMREHLEKLLGVPQDNIIYVENEGATQGAIKTALEGDLPSRVKAGVSDVYVYFAGHGAPDPASKTPYLVPTDGNPNFARQSCYSMASFYESLGNLGARSVTVMLDACFSGVAGRAGKAEGLLASARPLMIQLKDSPLPAGVTVLAAGTGEQVSLGLPKMKHGLFTYYLLKGLRGAGSRDGHLTPGTLASYLERMVTPEARRQGLVQTPVVIGDGLDRDLRK